MIANAPEPAGETYSAALAEPPMFVNLSLFECKLPAATDPRGVAGLCMGGASYVSQVHP